MQKKCSRRAPAVVVGIKAKKVVFINLAAANKKCTHTLGTGTGPLLEHFGGVRRKAILLDSHRNPVLCRSGTCNIRINIVAAARIVVAV